MTRPKETSAAGLWSLVMEARRGALVGEIRALARSVGSSVDVEYSSLRPPRLTEIRADWLSRCPRMGRLAECVREAFLSGVHALWVPDVGLRNEPIEAMRLFTLALAVLLGRPSPVAIGRGAVWDIRKRAPRGAGWYYTFSEHAHAAPLHTDSQFRASPEALILNYVVRQANDAGGRTSVARGVDVLDNLLEGPDGEEAEAILRSIPVPFRVPSLFADRPEAGPSVSRFCVLSEDPLVRFRRDTIRSGLKLMPECANPGLLMALQRLDMAIDRMESNSVRLHDDSLCVIDNHRMLHGRTSFVDPARHIVRVRVQSRQGPYDV